MSRRRSGIDCLQFEKIRAAPVAVISVTAEQAALRLYGPLARRDLSPATIAQVGQSLDGRIATASGEVGHVSGPDGLAHLHRMRALVDAVVIGVRTAIHDSPQLTVRHCEGENPARVVIDPSARLSDDSSVFHADGARRIVIQAVDTPRANGFGGHSASAHWRVRLSQPRLSKRFRAKVYQTFWLRVAVSPSRSF